MTESPDVILLRSADEPDPYLTAFEQAGLRAACEPVLTFAFPHQEALAGTLEHRDRYAALIATSPRVATALGRVFAEREALAESWREAPAYAVGPKTATRLRDVGFHPRGEDAGNAAALARQIVNDRPSAPLLFLSGNRRRDTLPTRLRAEEVPFEEVVVYETRTQDALTLPSFGPPSGSTWLVFFSPSGLEAVEKAESVDPSDYRVAAIGPTTGGTLEEAGYAVDAVAEEPSPEGLVAALQAAQRET